MVGVLLVVLVVLVVVVVTGVKQSQLQVLRLKTEVWQKKFWNTLYMYWPSYLPIDISLNFLTIYQVKLLTLYLYLHISFQSSHSYNNFLFLENELSQKMKRKCLDAVVMMKSISKNVQLVYFLFKLRHTAYIYSNMYLRIKLTTQFYQITRIALLI